jgi:hypothetical protein
MGNYQIGADIGPAFQGLVSSVRVPDGVLEATTAKVCSSSGTALGSIADAGDACNLTLGPLGEETTTKPFPPRQVSCDVSELSREVLVDE